MYREHILATFTIPDGETEPTGGTDGGLDDGGILSQGFAFGRILFPAAMDGTALLIQHKFSRTGTWVTANDADGVALTIATQEGDSARIPDAAFPAPWMRFVSNAAENTADIDFTVFLEA